jgi:hypothetical protein
VYGTVIFKLYLFDGHIYVDMTKNELKLMIKECINEVRIEEGAISSEEMAKKVMVLMKDIVKDAIGTNAGKVLSSDEELQHEMDILNETIKFIIVDKGIISCPIRFDKIDSIGVYLKDKKEIILSRDHFLLDDVSGGKYRFKYIRNIKFDEMYNAIEHELIHQQQDERSKGIYLKGKILNYVAKKYLNMGDDVGIGKIIDALVKNERVFKIYKDIKDKFLKKEYSDLISNRDNIDPTVSEDMFLELVSYFNKPSELNTFAKESVNKYIKNSLTYLKNDITFRFNRGGIESKKISGEEVRRLILPFLYSGKSGNSKLWSSSNVNIKKKILSYSPGYKYLTVENKKKWWIYVFQLLMSIKFEDI